jgi:hypothetical protein
MPPLPAAAPTRHELRSRLGGLLREHNERGSKPGSLPRLPTSQLAPGEALARFRRAATWVISAIRASRLFGHRGSSADVVAMKAADIAKDVAALKATSGPLRHGSGAQDDGLSSEGSGVLTGAGGRRLSAGGGGSRLQRGGSGAVPPMATIDEQGGGRRAGVVRSDSGVGAWPVAQGGSGGRRASGGGEHIAGEGLARVRAGQSGDASGGGAAAGGFSRALSAQGSQNRSSRRMWRKVRTAVRFSQKALEAAEAHASEGRDTDSDGAEGAQLVTTEMSSFGARSSFKSTSSSSTIIKASEATCQRVLKEAEVRRSLVPEGWQQHDSFQLLWGSVTSMCAGMYILDVPLFCYNTACKVTCRFTRTGCRCPAWLPWSPSPCPCCPPCTPWRLT